MRQASLTIFIEGDAIRKSIQIHAPVRVLNVELDQARALWAWRTADDASVPWQPSLDLEPRELREVRRQYARG